MHPDRHTAEVFAPPGPGAPAINETTRISYVFYTWRNGCFTVVHSWTKRTPIQLG
jgi:hypothetical protein